MFEILLLLFQNFFDLNRKNKQIDAQTFTITPVWLSTLKCHNNILLTSWNVTTTCFSQGPRYVVQIGEKMIDYNEEFKLFMTTRNPAPEIPPDGLAVITEVNFTTTRAGLTGQV